MTNDTQESLAEAKAKRDMLAIAVAALGELDDLLEKFSQWKSNQSDRVDNSIHPEF